MSVRLVPLHPPGKVAGNLKDIVIGDETFYYHFLVTEIRIYRNGEYIFGFNRLSSPYAITMRYMKFWFHEKYEGNFIFWYENEILHYATYAEKSNNRKVKYFEKLLHNNVVELIEKFTEQVSALDASDNILLQEMITYLQTCGGEKEDVRT